MPQILFPILLSLPSKRSLYKEDIENEVKGQDTNPKFIFSTSFQRHSRTEQTDLWPQWPRPDMHSSASTPTSHAAERVRIHLCSLDRCEHHHLFHRVPFLFFVFLMSISFHFNNISVIIVTDTCALSHLFLLVGSCRWLCWQSVTSPHKKRSRRRRDRLGSLFRNV